MSSYERIHWKDTEETPTSADNFNIMDKGIYDVHVGENIPEFESYDNLENINELLEIEPIVKGDKMKDILSKLTKLLHNFRYLLGKDYILEQGTIGIWTYEKWASGKAKCWGSTSMSFNCNSAWGESGLYHSAKTPAKETYPFQFVETPLCDYSVETTGDSSVIPMASGIAGTTETTPTVWVARTSVATVSGKVNWDIKGRWK